MDRATGRRSAPWDGPPPRSACGIAWDPIRGMLLDITDGNLFPTAARNPGRSMAEIPSTDRRTLLRRGVTTASGVGLLATAGQATAACNDFDATLHRGPIAFDIDGEWCPCDIDLTISALDNDYTRTLTCDNHTRSFDLNAGAVTYSVSLTADWDEQCVIWEGELEFFTLFGSREIDMDTRICV